MNNGGRRPPHNLYARTLTRHALLQSSLSHPQPGSEQHLPPNVTSRCDQHVVARRDHLLPDVVVTRCDQPRPIQRAPPFLSRSSNSLDILPLRHRPLFASGAGSSTAGLHGGLSASVLNLNDAPPDGAFAHYDYHSRQQREPLSGLRKRCDSTSALARLKPKRESSGCNNSEWGRKLSK